jgi:hypothetical protein
LVPAAISVTVSSGSTLGTVSGVESRIAVVAIDNAGTVELAVVNSQGYGAFDERLLINTTAEGGVGAADSASVFYSTSARTSVAFRVVGYIYSTQATAGSWASAPSNVNNDGTNKVQQLTSGTAVATTSGTSVDFTGIPSWVKRITVLLNGVSVSSNATLIARIGAGSIVTSGYRSTGSLYGGVNTTTGESITSGFLVGGGDAGYIIDGIATACLVGSDIWVWSTSVSLSSGNYVYAGAGRISLGGTLDRISITTVGAVNFDAGSINILYE